MKTLKYVLVFVLIIALLAPAGAAWADPDGGGKGGFIGGGGKGSKPGGETAGNNLSYPVIWAEGVTKTLPGTPGTMPVLNGESWYQWGTNGTDPDVTPASCPPDPDEVNNELNPADNPFCNDALPGSLTKPAGQPPADNPLPLAKAYVQKDQLNQWQAGSADWSDAPVNVHWIDWGDNLESVDWYTRSQVRTEVVLFQDLTAPMTEYEMRHTSGWGIDEVHGLAESLDDPPSVLEGDGTRATVYSRCARFTIQKLNVPRENLVPECLTWTPQVGWTENALNSDCGEDPINDVPLFNEVVYEAGDGPGYYNAEINVKGRIIYGYTWNVRQLNEGAGDYRLTFSLDSVCPDTLNTFFVKDITQIMVPIEEETEAIAAEIGEEPGGGATGVLRTDLNLTYMDVRILERGGGGKPQAAAANFMPELSFVPDEVISVDVKPQACPNVINIDLPGPEGNGNGPGGPGNGNGGNGSEPGGHVRAAVLGSASFDVADILLDSVRLQVPVGEGFEELMPEANHTVVEDVSTPYATTFAEPLDAYACHVLGADGFEDASFLFETPEIAELLAGTPEGTVVPLMLTGKMVDDRTFAGVDLVLINEGGPAGGADNTLDYTVFTPLVRNSGQ